MKPFKISIRTIALLIVCYFFSECKKENTQLNIQLFDKPLTTIKSNIEGKWKLYYSKGGICASCLQRYASYFWEFGSNDKIVEIYNQNITADTTIKWVKAPGTFTNVDSTYIMTFPDKQNVPWNYVVDGIYNDTLIIHDNSADAVFYHFIKY